MENSMGSQERILNTYKTNENDILAARYQSKSDCYVSLYIIDVKGKAQYHRSSI